MFYCLYCLPCTPLPLTFPGRHLPIRGMSDHDTACVVGFDCFSCFGTCCTLDFLDNLKHSFGIWEPIVSKPSTSCAPSSILYINTSSFHIYTVCYGGLFGFSSITLWSSLTLIFLFKDRVYRVCKHCQYNSLRQVLP